MTAWTPERRRQQAERMRARVAGWTPEQREELERKRLATRAANMARKQGAEPPAEAPTRPAPKPAPAAVQQAPAPTAVAPAITAPPPMPTCPLLGALLGQVMQSITQCVPAPAPVAAPTAHLVHSQAEDDVLSAAARLVRTPGNDTVTWFSAYADFFAAARALVAERAAKEKAA